MDSISQVKKDLKEQMQALATEQGCDILECLKYFLDEVNKEALSNGGRMDKYTKLVYDAGHALFSHIEYDRSVEAGKPDPSDPRNKPAIITELFPGLKRGGK